MIALFRYRVAWLRWFFNAPSYGWFVVAHGGSYQARENWRLATRRWLAQMPRRE